MSGYWKIQKKREKLQNYRTRAQGRKLAALRAIRGEADEQQSSDDESEPTINRDANSYEEAEFASNRWAEREAYRLKKLRQQEEKFLRVLLDLRTLKEPDAERKKPVKGCAEVLGQWSVRDLKNDDSSSGDADDEYHKAETAGDDCSDS